MSSESFKYKNPENLDYGNKEGFQDSFINKKGFLAFRLLFSGDNMTLNGDNNIRYKALLKSREYKIELKKLSLEIRRKCEEAKNEATVSSYFETSVYYFVKSFFGKELNFSKEISIGNLVRHIFSNKRLDVITNNLIIEYKHSSKLKSVKDIEKAINQTKDYLKFQIKAGNNYEAILTDGLKIKFVYRKNGNIIDSTFTNINTNILDRVIKNLLFFDKKKLAGSNIANDFNINAPNDISKNFASVLFESIKNENIVEKTNMLFNEWRDLFHLSETDKGKNRDIDKRRKGLGEIFSCEINNNDLEYKALFCLQTTYAVIVKLTALKALNQITLNNRSDIFEKLNNVDSVNLKIFLQQLEDGYTFKNIGIRNLLEGDFFAWYCDDNQWSNDIYLLIKEILDVLNSYEDLKFTETYEPQDLFKDLYLGTIPKYVRHSLGEYFTPSWLVDSVITNSLDLIKNKKWRAIDPCCGSGIFLVQLIKKILGEVDINTLTPKNKKELLQDILYRVNGIDLNPLSVLTARVNYFIAISGLIDDNEIEIPIYLGDSTNLPKIIIDISGVKCYKYSIETQKQTIDIELPVSFVKNKNFSEIMFLIQVLVKAEEAKDISSKILNSVDKKDKTKIIEKKIKNLAKELVSLHKNKWDGIWVRIMSNFLSTAKLGLFDIIVSNPPWVKWEFLPQSYANKIKKLCVDKHLFSGSVRTGGISLNICALIANTSASQWLLENGVLAFLMPKTLMTQQSYEGFRNFYLDIKKKKRLYIQKIDDWSNSGNPFITTQEKFLTYFLSSKPIDYSKGFPIYEYHKKNGIKIEEINTKKEFNLAKLHFEIITNEAKQLNKNRTNFSFINKISKYNFRDIIGENFYKARSGAEFTPAEVYFLKSIGKTNHKDTYNFKNVPLKTSKYKVVSKDKIELETKYIYPLVKSPNIKPFYYKKSEDFAIFPYDWGIKNNVSFTSLNNSCRRIAEYLTDYKNLIEQQSQRSLDLSIGNEFYALSKIGDYTFVNSLVTFRDNTKMCATVVTPIKTPWGKKKMPICAKHAPYISMTKSKRPITLDEAFYICGILNTPIVVEYILQSSDLRSISIDLPIKLPEYNPKDKNFNNLSKLSKKAQNLAKANKDLNEVVKKIEKLYLAICKYS